MIFIKFKYFIAVGFKAEQTTNSVSAINGEQKQQKVVSSPSKHFSSSNVFVKSSQENRTFMQTQQQQQQQRSASSPRTPSAPLYEGNFFDI